MARPSKGMTNKRRHDIWSIILNSTDESDFITKYKEKFGDPKTPEELLALGSWWKERTKIAARHPELIKPKPKTSTIKATGNGSDIIVDENTTTLINISNKLSEIIQIEKELSGKMDELSRITKIGKELYSSMDRIIALQIDQNNLFHDLSKKSNDGG